MKMEGDKIVHCLTHSSSLQQFILLGVKNGRFKEFSQHKN